MSEIGCNDYAETLPPLDGKPVMLRFGERWVRAQWVTAYPGNRWAGGLFWACDDGTAAEIDHPDEWKPIS